MVDIWHSQYMKIKDIFIWFEVAVMGKKKS